jgi:hypothetical protein
MKIQPGVGYNFDSSSRGFTLDTSEPFPGNLSDGSDHPFKITRLTYDTGGSTWLYQVVPGAMNNEIPQILEDGVWVLLNRMDAGVPNYPTSVLNFTAGISYVYLRAGVDVNGYYPGQDNTLDEWPRIISSGTELVDTDTYGYIKIAQLTATAVPSITVNQYVTGSLFGDRIKLGSITAKYYYSRV